MCLLPIRLFILFVDVRSSRKGNVALKVGISKTYIDCVFSIEIGPKRARVVGPFVEPDRCTTCTERVVRRGVCRSPLR